MNRHLLFLTAFAASNLVAGCMASANDPVRESQDALVTESHFTATGIAATLSERDSTTTLVRFDYDKASAIGDVSLVDRGYRTQFEVPATAAPLTLQDGSRTVQRMWAGRDRLDDTQRLRCRWVAEMDCELGWWWNDNDPTPGLCCWW